jgi:cob(I)alamin adenosyltransferase
MIPSYGRRRRSPLTSRRRRSPDELYREAAYIAVVSIATKTGDKGTTGLLFGGRVRKDSIRIECNGAVDEAQAALGYARAVIAATATAAESVGTTGGARKPGGGGAAAATAAKTAASAGAGGSGEKLAAFVSAANLETTIIAIERDLWVLMAEVATAPSNRRKLQAGASLVTEEMVARLTGLVDELEALEVMPTEFVVPGNSLPSAALDLARTVVRRAERLAVGLDLGGSSSVVPYLNRLSDLCWLLARALEAEHVLARTQPRKRDVRRPARP